MSSELEPIYRDGAVEVERTITGPLNNNVFFVRCRATGQAVMIDAPGGNPALLVDLCASAKIKIAFITHNHHDHIGAVRAIRGAGIRVHVGHNDAHGVDHDEVIRDGETFTLGNVMLRAISTPGHTPGSVCFAVDQHPLLFSGDTLFPGGPGATNKPGSDFDAIIASIDRLFSNLSDDTLVLPGHGAATTIGDEKPHLPEWIARGW